MLNILEKERDVTKFDSNKGFTFQNKRLSIKTKARARVLGWVIKKEF